MFNYILNSIKTGQCFCSTFPHTMNRISNSAIFFSANKFQILEPNHPWGLSGLRVTAMLEYWRWQKWRLYFHCGCIGIVWRSSNAPYVQKTKVPESEQIVKNKIFSKDNSGHFPPSLAGYDLWCVKSPGLFQSVWVSTVLQEHLTFLFQSAKLRFILHHNFFPP